MYGETSQKWNSLKEMVDSIQMSDEVDRVKWKIGTTRKFRVKDLYIQLREEREPLSLGGEGSSYITFLYFSTELK
jgi:hypothetical protein